MLVSLDIVSSCAKAAGNSRKEAVLQHVSIGIPCCQNDRVMLTIWRTMKVVKFSLIQVAQNKVQHGNFEKTLSSLLDIGNVFFKLKKMTSWNKNFYSFLRT
jgi:hypothetical protein